MARLAVNEFEAGYLGQRADEGDLFFDLGMMYATGRSVAVDLVAAHKWFNLACLRGKQAAKTYREEIAAELSKSQLAQALQSARTFLASNKA
ncbi:MAG: SEL1-like repeat protein [Rhizobiales bacterium]|nr:SEL1-like repeat protein [Hyphomicrobiales bacterium]MBO6698071.1 SEL1-like repeat protein [Hyphomicrobiales bacterium]MBO6735675.1 SEL1-like repeat protein [Hyphomicrobiales bacterium]MBO6910517.1 SEL1-like repeat protein [Hyphomicrobiales bacterium]MBO6956132.1 SEL1-like repeat protein [Hyphomicrobiales bacterium]